MYPRRSDGKSIFTKSSNVNYAGAGVESLHGCHRHAFIAVLAVVVVFDDPRTGTVRPFDQLQAACGAHGGAERILMRRCDVRYARISAQLDAGRNVQSFAIHGNGHQPATGQRQSVAQKYVARLLDPDGGVGIQQDPGR